MGGFIRLFRATQNDIKLMHFNWEIYFDFSRAVHPQVMDSDGYVKTTIQSFRSSSSADLKNGTNHVPLTQFHARMSHNYIGPQRKT